VEREVHVLPIPFFKAVAKPGPPTLGPRQTNTHQFAFVVLAPFTDPPQYIFPYNDVRETTKPPLFLTKFMVFFERWATSAVTNQIARASYQIAAPGDPTPQMAAIMAGVLRVPVFRLEVQSAEYSIPTDNTGNTCTVLHRSAGPWMCSDRGQVHFTADRSADSAASQSPIQVKVKTPVCARRLSLQWSASMRSVFGHSDQ
jgi:hypothetical protein